MRILIATAHRAVVGGAETHLRAVVPLLRAAGHAVGVLYERPAPPGAATITPDPDPDGPAWAAADPDLFREIADWRPDVVYSHGLADPDLDEELAARFPAVLFAHNYHGTCVSGTKCHARRGHRPCHKPLGPGCLPVYLPFGCGGANPVTMLRLYRGQRRRQATLGRYRAVLVASRHMAAEYRRNGVPADRVHVVPLFPPGVAPDPAPPAPRPRTDRVLFAGRLTNLKGGDHLIEALARTTPGRPLTLVVAGDGPERTRLEALARRRGVPAEFRGWVGGGELAALTRGCDLVAVPSLWPEPFGLVGIEAGCGGVPAVGYAAGGIPDWLEPGVSGESAPADRPDPGELAAAVSRALADDDHWQRLRVGAWETARRFSPEEHRDRLLAVLAAAAGGGDG